MMRKLLAVALLVLVVPLAPPCGPYFNDAHHGLDHDLLEGSLERFYLRLMHRGEDLEAVVKASATARTAALAAEAEGRFEDARALYVQALAGAGYDSGAVHAWRIREMRDRIDLLPLVGHGFPVESWSRYRAAVSQQLERWQPQPREEQRQLLLELAAGADSELAAAALVSLAWGDLIAEHLDAAREHLAASLARAPTSVKADEATFLLAIAPVFAHLSTDGHVDDPVAVLAAIDRWLAEHPLSPWRPHALSWKAGILSRLPEPASGSDRPLLDAVRIWQDLVADPAAAEAFVPAVESLRWAYRRLRPTPPASVVVDPRHAVAFAWHAVTDRGSFGDSGVAALTAAEPALARLAHDTDPAVLRALAEMWIAAGRKEAALPLARAALAARDEPATRYLVARAAADLGDPAEAEQALAPLPHDDARLYDLLMRTGSVWEARAEWVKALSAYVRANSQMDVVMLTDGEMPLDVLIERVRGGEPAVAEVDHSWAFGDVTARAGRDFMPDLRRILARRLVRSDRAEEAQPLFEGELRGLCAGLIVLQRELAQATPAQRPDRLWALASFWYDPGRKLLFEDRFWHQWGWYHFFGGNAAKDASLEVQRARYAREMEAMSVYERAYPLFMEIADTYPKHAHAPDALYHAALCRYWPCGQTYLQSSPYWMQRARAEGYWAQGDALLRRLAAEHPDDPLAHDAKVQRALDGTVPKPGH